MTTEISSARPSQRVAGQQPTKGQMMTEMTKTPSDTPFTDASDAALVQKWEIGFDLPRAMDRGEKKAREAAKLAAAYDAAKGPAKIDWTRPTAGILDQTPARNNTQYFQADTMAEAMALATAEADKIVAATGRNVGVCRFDDVRVRNEAPAQSMALAWQAVRA